MSLTKRQFEAAAENKLREEKKTCGCKWEYSGNFEILCDKHFTETHENMRAQMNDTQAAIRDLALGW